MRAVGTVTGNDYQQVALPLFHDARRAGRRIRLLYHFGPEFEGFTAGAVLGDARIGLQYLRPARTMCRRERSPHGTESARLIGAMLPCPFRVFGNDEWQTAIGWLNSPATARLAHRLIRESGVLVVQPVGPLCPEDFEAVALMVDPWIESHGALQGLVVQLRDFPARRTSAPSSAMFSSSGNTTFRYVESRWWPMAAWRI